MNPCSLAFVALAAPPHDEVTSLPDHFEILELEGTFDKPLDLAFAADGTLFVAGKHGEVWVHDGVERQAERFVDLRDEVNSYGDRGLLSMALHPDFAADGGATSWVYLLYTVSPVPGTDPDYNANDQHSFGRLARYRAVTGADGIVADAGSRQVLLGNPLGDGTVPDALPNVHLSHATGFLGFGSDGSLLLTCGEGAHFNGVDAGGRDPAAFETFVHPQTGLKGPLPADQDCGAFRAQDLRSLGGKVLRVDPETGGGYASNPFYDGDPFSNASRVWALGLRNPFRASLLAGTGATDPSLGQPGALLVGDVGWKSYEELNLCLGGENFGWPCFEGAFPNAGYDEHVHDPNPLGFPDCSSPGPGISTGALVSWNHEDPGEVFPPGLHTDEEGSPLPGFIGSCTIAGAHYPGGDYPAHFAGRYFFADYGDDWIRTLTLDSELQVTEIADFAFDVVRLSDIAVHPISGDVHYSELGDTSDDGEIHRVRYGANLTPVALVTAAPLSGPAPLTVDFDASASLDPEMDPLDFTWDFGDGSPVASGPETSHTFDTDGVYEVTLLVADDGGQVDTELLQIAVGVQPPVARVLAPLPGTLFQSDETLEFLGAGSDPEGEELTYSWSVDLYHDTHVHPDFAILPGQNTTYVASAHGGADELNYLRIELTVENESGLRARDHVFVYPPANLLDPTGQMLPIARVQELFPPYPTGSGNPDIEVVRDTDQPPIGTVDRKRQFDTYHAGDQGDDDWIGFELTDVPHDTVRFTSLVFQEGVHYAGGGWFESLAVEVREDGVWEPVNDLEALPPYPFEFAATPGFDGVSYNSYELQFDPTYGDAIRLRGKPGGAHGFISVGELRVRYLTPIELDPPWRDLTSLGSPMTKVQELTPPAPQGEGSKDLGILSNGTWPPAGSASKYGQVDTFHFGDQGDEDWFGYRFDAPQLFQRVVFQEGFHYAGGGWFETFDVETRPSAAADWEPVAGLSVYPSPPGDTGSTGTYETFEFLFESVVGSELRIVGEPGGADGFVSVGELRVFGPTGCGWTPYGTDAGGTNLLTLHSPTPAKLGASVDLVTQGPPGTFAGNLFFAYAPWSLEALGGTLLVNPTSAVLTPIVFDSSGASSVSGPLTSSPVFANFPFYLQAFAAHADHPGQILFSNGLELRICL